MADAVAARITHARITEMPKGMMDPMPKVMIRVEGEAQERELFWYYPDEISFTADEFIGLTVTEAQALKFRKDVAYLRS